MGETSFSTKFRPIVCACSGPVLAKCSAQRNTFSDSTTPNWSYNLNVGSEKFLANCVVRGARKSRLKHAIAINNLVTIFFNFALHPYHSSSRNTLSESFFHKIIILHQSRNRFKRTTLRLYKLPARKPRWRFTARYEVMKQVFLQPHNFLKPVAFRIRNYIR